MLGAISSTLRPNTPPPRVVIIGAGFGRLWAAKTLANAPVEVIVIDRENYHLFQPLLYQVATAGLSPADVAAPIRSIVGTLPSCLAPSRASTSRRARSWSIGDG